MTQAFPNLVAVVAQSSANGEAVREIVAYELSRLSQFDDPRVLVAIVVAAAVAFVLTILWFYRRERASIPAGFRWLLPMLRLIAVVGIGLFFLGLQKRHDQQIVTDSQVLLLVDTSQSMAVEDESSSVSKNISRGEVVAQALGESKLIDTLLDQHDVSLLGFDQHLTRVANWPRMRASATAPSEKAGNETEQPWQEKLQPSGTETRFGEALRRALAPKSGRPLAGVIVLSDGGQNRGIDPLGVADLYGQRQVPVYTIGVGSTQPRRNLRVKELNAPSRVYPDDQTTVTCLIQGEGYAGRSVNLELHVREGGADRATADRVGSEQLSFDSDRQLLPVEFDIEPAEVGRLVLELRILAPSDDQYAGDNIREVEIEVVEARMRVLLVASGATRDYRFLRNQLLRDRHAKVDVWLQYALPGISQDADEILDDFPLSKQELYSYDCIVAFDPDWTLLDAQQVDLLESWVAEEAGGLVVVAGPIHTASWVQNPEQAKIRALYPVEFQRWLTLLDDGLYGSRIPWPIEFSKDGEESDFLWLADSLVESRSLWSRFAGVFGCYAVKGPKPGARVLGRYSDPDAGLSADRPVYFAEHFYGGGRVFYMGSGELWRLRSMDVGYFEILYTRLIRHVTQGRLLRGSSRGRMLLERDRYSVGDDVVVRAQLTTDSRQPLIAESLAAIVVDPDRNQQTLKMIADQDRVGNFVGQFSVPIQGSYRIELDIPDSVDQKLIRRIQVVAPNLEYDETRRNETLLAALANRSGGLYYTNLASALKGSENLGPVAKRIESRAETKTLRGTPDQDFTEWLHRMLLMVICGALGLEWLLRRLSRLA